MSLKGSHSNIEFNDHSEEIIKLLGEAVVNGLEAIGMTAETYAKKEISRPKASSKSLVLFVLAQGVGF